MHNCVFFPIGTTKACLYAAEQLKHSGHLILDHPAPEVTHLLLDVPSFQDSGLLRSGEDLKHYLQMLPSQVTVIGGNLNHPDLAQYQKMDLLQKEGYLAKNAAITAECALTLAASQLETTLSGTPCLIIGWGRIGKCLAQKLKCLGANPIIAARSPRDRAILEALDYSVTDIPSLNQILPYVRVLFNTVPAPVLFAKDFAQCRDCLKIELASKPGMEGVDIVQARGLPGTHAPRASGKLIANTIENWIKEEPL